MSPYIKYIILPILITLALSQLVYAGDWMEFHIGSNHAGEGYVNERGDFQPYNETNLGVGLMHGIDEHTEVGFGYYDNSYNRSSFYTGLDYHTSDRLPIRLGVSAAIVSGYAGHQPPVILLPNVTVRVCDSARIKIGWLPGNDGLVTLTAGVNF